MTDAQDIEQAYRLIERYVGEGALPEHVTDYDALIADIVEMDGREGEDTIDELAECGDWAVNIALKRYWVVMA